MHASISRAAFLLRRESHFGPRCTGLEAAQTTELAVHSVAQTVR
jgi:hypothetical protein